MVKFSEFSSQLHRSIPGSCLHHTGFGLSLGRVAALTPAAWTPPVADGDRPVPAPCDLPRPRCFGPLSAAPPPHLANFITSTEAPPRLTSFPLRVHLLALSPHFGLRWPISPLRALPRVGRHSHCAASAPLNGVNTVWVWETLPSCCRVGIPATTPPARYPFLSTIGSLRHRQYLPAEPAGLLSASATVSHALGLGLSSPSPPLIGVASPLHHSITSDNIAYRHTPEGPLDSSPGSRMG